MNAPLQLAIREQGAARMLDLSPRAFRELVAVGALPPPVEIGGHERWRVDDLRAIVDGTKARPNDDIEI